MSVYRRPVFRKRQASPLAARHQTTTSTRDKVNEQHLRRPGLIRNDTTTQHTSHGCWYGCFHRPGIFPHCLFSFLPPSLPPSPSSSPISSPSGSFHPRRRRSPSQHLFSALHPSCAPRILPPLPSFRPWGLNMTRDPLPIPTTTTNERLPSLSTSWRGKTTSESPSQPEVSKAEAPYQPSHPPTTGVVSCPPGNLAANKGSSELNLRLLVLPRADEFLSTRFHFAVSPSCLPPTSEPHDDPRCRQAPTAKPRAPRGTSDSGGPATIGKLTLLESIEKDPFDRFKVLGQE